MKCLFKKYKKANSGFTLIELVLAITISSLLITGLATFIYQLISYPEKVKANSVIIQQAQNLSYWISRDGQMIQHADIGDNPNTVDIEVFTFSWVDAKKTDINNNDYIRTFLIKYVCDAGRLTRNQYLHIDTYDSDGQLISSSDSYKEMFIAEYVYDIDGSINTTRLTVSATFSYADTQIQRTYDITPKAYFLN
jgi:prepilin-type N-terminal cleavage/methylation domain-containing protein